eukprot:289759-Prymnesium_polylepis.1
MAAHCRSGKGGGSVRKAKKYCMTDGQGNPKKKLTSSGVRLKKTKSRSQAGPKKMAYVRGK